ncbi:uncharacterized protein C18orf63 homolog [Centroberyx affinis]|uniref:uncharacterized protein C18orf63 homolog n=1 Tax=Centroberyx affinis TaxID=166261 RepID=UPI003A5C5950
MSGGGQQSLFFLSLPELRKLCCVSLSLQEEEEESRSKQMKTCRELVLLYSDILASPALDSFTQITVVMAIPFFKKGIIQAYGQRRNLQLGSPQCVLPGILQSCVSYSLTSRLAPSWNKAGLYLVSGKDFLTESGRLNAVTMQLSTTENQLCVSLEASSVRLPPTRLEDFDLPPLVLRSFCSRPDSVLHTFSNGGTIWCHVLPSMKKGQIITISRQLPKDGPFRSYTDLQNHWNRLYGYRLPDLAEEEAVYCSVYFKLVGDRLFTYPLSCVRLQPLQRCPRVDQQEAPGRFLSDARDALHSVCGFPVRMTGRPCYHTAGLTSAASAQVLSGEPVNLTTVSSGRPVLTQLPAPAARPTKPSSGSQPPAWPPLSQQAGGGGGRRDRTEEEGGSQDSGYRCGRSQIQSQRCGGEGELPSSTSSCVYSSSFSSSPPFSYSSSGYQSASTLSSSSSSSSSFMVNQSAPSLPFSSSASSSSSSSFTVHQSAPSLPFSSSSSSLFSPLPPPPSQTPVIPPAPILVPIFRNKCPSRLVNATLLRAQRQKERRGGGGEERGRVTLPAKRPAPLSSSSSSSSFSLSGPSFPSSSSSPMWPQRLQIPPPPVIPRFTHRSKSLGVNAPPKPNRVLDLSPASRPKPGLSLSPAPHLDLKSKSSSSQNSVSNSRVKAPQPPSAPPPQPPPPLAPSEIPSSRGGDLFESKPKRSRSAVQDVEKMARSSQLSKVKSATLLVWLKGRGVAVRTRDRKEELMLKVMGCLAEA